MLYSSIVGLMSSDLEGVYTFSAKSWAIFRESKGWFSKRYWHFSTYESQETSKWVGIPLASPSSAFLKRPGAPSLIEKRGKGQSFSNIKKEFVVY